MSDLLDTTITLGVISEPGGYFSVVKIFLILALILPWLWVSTWINKDAARVHTHKLMWSGLVLGSGVLSLFIWLLAPWYVFGLILYLVVVGSIVGTYVVYRNNRVVYAARVLTAEHLMNVFSSATKSSVVETVHHIKMYDNLGRPVFAPPVEEPEKRRTYNLAQNFLNDVVLFRASEVDLSPAGTRATVRFMVDGVLQQRPVLDHSESENIIDFVKSIAGMNTNDKRRPQTGKIGVEGGAVTTDMDVTTAGTTQGQRMQIRIVQEAIRTDLGNLGLSEDLKNRLEEINSSVGLIIVSGARGSGATSTLYSLLRRHDAFIRQLATLESGNTVDLENVTQIRYKDQTELAGKLASLLRRDPDVVMIEACGTAQAADLICEASADKSILLGFVSASTLAALANWVKVTGDAAKAVKPLKAITCQTLLRKLCPNCKEAYTPPRDMLAKLNLPAEKIDAFYRPPTKPLTDEKGNPAICQTCRGTGYYGRTGVFELLEITDEIRELVTQNAPLARIKAACRKNKMLYLQEKALRKVISGITSIEEVIRVSRKK
ncbi:MAG: ATPase, T2SS/T4P/T4SS family [Planctomycetota bacterium]|nr:ATPase, T2SS/T4P/T4SS family [Planctomycetota bacterium]